MEYEKNIKALESKHRILDISAVEKKVVAEEKLFLSSARHLFRIIKDCRCRTVYKIPILFGTMKMVCNL